MMIKYTEDGKVIRKINETLRHFPNDINDKIQEYVINDVLLESRYIFTTRRGRLQFGYCTHCKNEYKTNGLKHKTESTCPKCKSNCKVQAAGYSRKYMVDEAYFVFYEKSKINKEAVIARGFTVWMDYSKDYKNVKPEFAVEARYLFEMGNPVFIKTGYAWPDNREYYELRKSVFSLFKHYYFFGIPSKRNQKVNIQSIEKAVKGTQFQYSEWSQFNQEDLDDYVSYFALYSRYPQIEYLMKLGFRDFVRRKLFDQTVYRTINWNGKSIDKVLRIDKQDTKDVIKHSKSIDPFALAVYQLGKKDGSNFSIKEAVEIRHLGLETEFDRVKQMLKRTRFRRLLNYLRKQVEQVNEIEAMVDIGDETDRIYTTVREQLITLDDYWEGCRNLGLTIGKDIAEFPGDLQSAHDNVFKQLTFKENKELDRKIESRLKELGRYEYENEKYFIRPFESTYEIIQEGKELKHCVGTYSKRYANGKTDLFAIREKSNPEKPFYTLEVTSGKVRQYYGYRNKKQHKEIDEFIKEFERDILNKTEKEIAS